MSDDYSRKLQDPRFQKLRLLILSAANWKCEDCSSGTIEFQLHHCAYIRGKEPWQYGIDLLMCLCDTCHKKRQDRENAFRVALGRITRHLPPEQLEDEVWRMLEEVSRRETNRLAEPFLPEEPTK
jgi:hypothetical protein